MLAGDNGQAYLAMVVFSMLCIDRTGEVLRDIGAERQLNMSEKEFKEAAHQTDRTMLFVLLIFAGIIRLSIALSMFLSK